MRKTLPKEMRLIKAHEKLLDGVIMEGGFDALDETTPDWKWEARLGAENFKEVWKVRYVEKAAVVEYLKKKVTEQRANNGKVIYRLDRIDERASVEELDAA